MPFDPSSGALDVILGIAAVATAVALIRSWRSFWDDDFTPKDRRLGGQVAVFLVPPIVVLLHEAGHLVAARSLGLKVLDFHYGLFEGSVTVGGLMTPFQQWFVAIAGNVVSAVLGLALLAVGFLGRRLRAPVRYVLLAGGMLELVFSLVVYPVLSGAAQFGDWIVVYDFDRTPGLSWATAVVHAALLLALWQWWRRTGRVTLFAVGSGTEVELAERQSAGAAEPADVGAWLALVDFYARHGELGLSRDALARAVAACGDHPRLHLVRARLSLFQGRASEAVSAARKGLEVATSDEEVRQKLWANLALALTEMERAQPALDAYGQLSPPVLDDARVRYGRGLVRLQSGDREGGRSDLEAVVTALPEGHLLRRWAEARLEGRLPEEEPDPGVPAYQRGKGPPPAPVHGV